MGLDRAVSSYIQELSTKTVAHRYTMTTAEAAERTACTHKKQEEEVIKATTTHNNNKSTYAALCILEDSRVRAAPPVASASAL